MTTTNDKISQLEVLRTKFFALRDKNYYGGVCIVDDEATAYAEVDHAGRAHNQFLAVNFPPAFVNENAVTWKIA